MLCIHNFYFLSICKKKMNYYHETFLVFKIINLILIIQNYKIRKLI